MCHLRLTFFFVFVVIHFFLNVKTSKLENRLEYADPYTVETEMMLIPVMTESAEVVFGKTGILTQLPGLRDTELAIILLFLENPN